MTAIITIAPLAIRRPTLLVPKLGLGVAMAALSKAVGQAFDMAYVAPYQTISQSPRVVFDTDLEGRDPNW